MGTQIFDVCLPVLFCMCVCLSLPLCAWLRLNLRFYVCICLYVSLCLCMFRCLTKGMFTLINCVCVSVCLRVCDCVLCLLRCHVVCPFVRSGNLFYRNLHWVKLFSARGIRPRHMKIAEYVHCANDWGFFNQLRVTMRILVRLTCLAYSKA